MEIQLSDLRIVFFLVCISCSSGAAIAETPACEAELSRMVGAMEIAASASAVGDACGTADAIEVALNAAGDAQSECTAEGYSLAKKYVVLLPSKLASAVQFCGH